ncbi:hypothetical protein TL16_g04134 [Triparma laevis f. inornata]|uniref:Uncharacterized protein n=1 Tax=Triparma laevis f. inornata TaxID=1714386 RepID=A0A9W7A3I8_9STRA|nr:hypothetical protein TL16_g04134 [Triparma laevis f. inornata]
MSLTDTLPENGSFSVALTTCSLCYKQSAITLFPTQEEETSKEGDVALDEVQPVKAPECYVKLILENLGGAFPGEEKTMSGEGEEETKIDPAVTLTSETTKGELVEGTTYNYGFTLSAESKAKLAVASNLITSALINDGGSVEVWMKGAEGAEDEKLGGGSFKMNFDGAEIELALGVVEEVEKKEESVEGEGGEEEKKAEDGGEGREDAQAVEKVEEDTSPGSLAVFGSTSKIGLKVAISESISDYVQGGASFKFGEIVVEDINAHVFGVSLTVEDEVSNDDYLVQLGEKLAEKNAASKYAVEISGECLPTMVVEGGSVSFEVLEVEAEPEVEPEAEVEEEEVKAEGEGDVEVKEGEEAPPAPIVRPSIQYKLTFETGSSPVFLSYEEGKSLKTSIRAGESTYTVVLRKSEEVVESSELVVDDKKGKKGKGKKEAEVEAEPEAEYGAEDHEESCAVRLGGLIEAGASKTVVRGSLGEGMSGLVGVVSLEGACLFKGVSDGEGLVGGSEAIAELAGLPCVKYAKSLDRDMFAELKDKMDGSVDALVEEYASLFLLNEDANKGLSKQEKLKKMLYHLNKKGGYFELKEALKPCLQRVVAEKLEGPKTVNGNDLFLGKGAPRLDTDEGNDYVTALFDFLLAELNQSLTRKFVPQCVLECREGISNDISVAKNVPNKMVKLKMLAEDAEGNGEFDKSRKWHLDRIKMAEVETRNEKFGFRYLIKSKVDFADFILSCGGARSEAVSALVDAVGLDVKDVDNVTLLSALLLDEGVEGNPLKYLNGVFEMLLGEDESGDGFDEDSYAGVGNASVLSVLTAIWYKSAGEGADMRKALRIAGKAAKLGGSAWPKRHVVAALLDAAEFLLNNKLGKAAKACLNWVVEFEEKAKAAARDVGGSTGGVRELRARFSLCSARLKFLNGDFEAAKVAVVDAEKRYKGGENAEKGMVALVYASIVEKLGDKGMALAKYLSALKLLEDPVPFTCYVALYGLLSSAERWAEAREVMFRAAKSWSYSSVWLSISKASIKLGYLEDAEDSLQESNGADTNDPRSWGLFVIVCLKMGERLQEANEGLKQCLSLGLSDLSVLREMGDLFVEIDEMVQAEAVWRRTVEVKGGVEFGLRLSKCLEAQREFEKALKNYDLVVGVGGKGLHLVEQERAKLVKKMGKDI